jgi:hypothetical protein
VANRKLIRPDHRDPDISNHRVGHPAMVAAAAGRPDHRDPDISSHPATLRPVTAPNRVTGTKAAPSRVSRNDPPSPSASPVQSLNDALSAALNAGAAAGFDMGSGAPEDAGGFAPQGGNIDLIDKPNNGGIMPVLQTVAAAVGLSGAPLVGTTSTILDKLGPEFLTPTASEPNWLNPQLDQALADLYDSLGKPGGVWEQSIAETKIMQLLGAGENTINELSLTFGAGLGVELSIIQEMNQGVKSGPQ